MQYSEFGWISLVDILDFKQPTRKKFQSVSNYVINYMCSLERHFICLQPMSFSNSSSGSLTQGLKASYFLCKQEYSTSICNSQITSISLKTCVKASFFKYCDIISGS